MDRGHPRYLPWCTEVANNNPNGWETPFSCWGGGDEVAPISDGRGPGLPGAWRKTRRRAELSAFITCVNVRRFI